MPHLQGHARTQSLLVPAAIDDYVGPDNPVRFIEAFVDQLDLEAAGFGRVRAKATGRPGYHLSPALGTNAPSCRNNSFHPARSGRKPSGNISLLGGASASTAGRVSPDGSVLKHPSEAEVGVCLGITPELDLGR